MFQMDSNEVPLKPITRWLEQIIVLSFVLGNVKADVQRYDT